MVIYHKSESIECIHIKLLNFLPEKYTLFENKACFVCQNSCKLYNKIFEIDLRNKNQERFARHTSLEGEGQFLNSAPIRV